MPYKRPYGKTEVHELLYESESRPSPKTGKGGHTVKYHADGRADISDRRQEIVYHLPDSVDKFKTMSGPSSTTIPGRAPAKDSRFTSRKDLVMAVWQGLNSGDGQNALARFDADRNLARVTFGARLGTPIKRVERFSTSTSTIETGLVAHSIFFIIDRLGDPKGCQIHIQSAYPKDVRNA